MDLARARTAKTKDYPINNLTFNKPFKKIKAKYIVDFFKLLEINLGFNC